MIGKEIGSVLKEKWFFKFRKQHEFNFTNHLKNKE